MMEQAAGNNGSVVPGQGVLPGLLDVMKIESAVLRKPEQESFCWELVTNNGDRGRAYQVAINPECDRVTAQKRASDLMKKPEITGRVAQISSIIQRKYEQSVISYRLKGLTLDRGEMVDGDGKLKSLAELTEEQRQVVDLEVKWVDGGLRTIPVVASREKSADALQKMFGMNKDSLAVTGKDGAPLNPPAPVGILVTNFDEFRELAKGKVNPPA